MITREYEMDPLLSEKQEIPESNKSDEWGWTRTHQIGLAILTFCLLMFLGMQLWRHPIRLDSSLTVSKMHRRFLENRVDLNSAGWASMVRLPGIGPGRADRIIAYRRHEMKLHPGSIVFGNIRDLRLVPGIGKQICLNLLPFLKFPPSAQAATRP